MPTKLTALTQATILGATDLLYAVVGGNSRAIPAQALAGRNRIINGSGRVNQRVYVSGTATTGANQYTLDRWRVVTSGQSLTFTGNEAGRVMTAPAGGVEQVIEEANIEGGTFVINWSGTASCTVNGVSRVKGESFTLPAATQATVRFSGGTFTDVQLEAGTVATPFERLPFGDVLFRCQRYFEAGAVAVTGYQAAGSGFGAYVPFAVPKRTTPTISFVSPNYLNASGLTAFLILQTGFNVQAAATATSAASYYSGFTANAEI